MNKWTEKLMPHWRFIVFELCILIGGFLILPAFRLIPFLLESAFTQSQRIAQTSRVPGEASSPASASDPGFNQFIPYLSQGEDGGTGSQTAPQRAPFFEAVDFSPGSAQITLRIFPDGGDEKAIRLVDVSFLPGNRCEFGDGRACIYPFESAGGGRVIFASVHSGLGAEAETFRDLIEGTGINRALLDEQQVSKNMQALTGARIAVSQGETQIDGLSLSAVVRIPPEHMADYMQTPVEELLNFAVETNVLDPGYLLQDLLVFETCGWGLPGETPVPGVPNTSTSVYLGVIVSPEP